MADGTHFQTSLQDLEKNLIQKIKVAIAAMNQQYMEQFHGLTLAIMEIQKNLQMTHGDSSHNSKQVSTEKESYGGSHNKGQHSLYAT